MALRAQIVAGVALGLIGCGSGSMEITPGGGGNTESASTSSETGTTASASSMTGVDSDTAGGASTTGATSSADATSGGVTTMSSGATESTGAAESTGAVDPTTSTSGGTESESGTTGSASPEAYGPCLQGQECRLAEELCVSAGGYHVCTQQCTGIQDCPDMPAGGSANLQCQYTNGVNANLCWMLCTPGQCPPPMVCNPNGHCSWD